MKFEKVISSGAGLEKGTTMQINAQGIENSFRQALDGITYFGCKKTDSNNHVINDMVIPTLNEELAEKHRGRHFVIEYNLTHMDYRIRDLGIGFGAFYKLDFALKLKDNHLLNMGLVFMVVAFPELPENDNPQPGEVSEASNENK